MRLMLDIFEMTERQFEVAQKVVKAEYEFRPDDDRVCLVFRRDEEERHVEMPLADLSQLIQAFNMIPMAEKVAESLESLKEAFRLLGERVGKHHEASE